MDPDTSEYGEDSFADRMIYKDSSDTPQYLEGSDAINVNTPNDVVISSSGEPGSDGRFLDKAEPFNRQKPNEEEDTSAAEPTDNENEESHEQKQSEETSESNSSETSDTSTSSNTQENSEEKEKNEESPNTDTPDSGDASKESTSSNDENTPSADEEATCPFCGRKLIIHTLNGTPWFVHEHASSVECRHIFADRRQIQEAADKNEKMNSYQNEIDEIQKSNVERFESDRKAQEAEDKAKAETSPSAPPAPVPTQQMQQLSPEIMNLFKDEKNPSSLLLYMISENMKAVNVQIAKINEDIASLKKESFASPEVLKAAVQSTLKEDESLGELKKLTSDTSAMLKESNESIKKNIDTLSDTANTIMKQYSIAAMVYNQYIHSVRVIDKSRIRYATLLPEIKDYLKSVDAKYEAMLQNHDKEAKAVAQNFTKQINQFMSEARKKHLLAVNGKGASSDGLLSYVIPTIIAFVLMMIISFVSR